ncbi:DUF5342 family protein [Pullulanibacillus sp. KACC 23026]|uniref:DUF5342 family protein n=1 Tax=Pullulanibacillus sp. KACC 23026 TaxID=3028315 RepID=UPI0023AEEC04|nr:DUF5342 family protein [Pullulanibacillus sp. KACC 23026]WEG12056.1 DUF5342 family protein [Pullulanibacillus sp. KACC 23026]
MFTHFTYQPFIASESRRREYQFSFYYKGTYFQGIYHFDGSIDWQNEPDEADKKALISQIHELMLYHVYE